MEIFNCTTLPAAGTVSLVGLEVGAGVKVGAAVGSIEGERVGSSVGGTVEIVGSKVGFLVGNRVRFTLGWCFGCDNSWHLRASVGVCREEPMIA